MSTKFRPITHIISNNSIRPISIFENISDPPIPPYTIRLKYKDGVTPTFSKGTGVLVDSTNNIWDLTYENTSWTMLLDGYSHKYNLKEVLGANTSGVTEMYGTFYNCQSLTIVSLFDTSGVTNMNRMFIGCSSLITVPLFDTSNATDITNMFNSCTSLTQVPLFDTSNATDMSNMFSECTSLTTIPLFDTSKVTSMNYMFSGCYNVQSGALALYNQASTQAKPPRGHSSTFHNCGRDTTTGAAELEQIPSDWK